MEIYSATATPSVQEQQHRSAQSGAMPRNSGKNRTLAENVIGGLLCLGGGMYHKLAIVSKLLQPSAGKHNVKEP
jgi:hypothetical protein